MLGFGTIAKKVFGTANDRKVKAVRPLVDQINALEPEFEALSDEGIIEKTQELRDRALKGESLDALLPEAFANCREAAKRALGLRAFDTQLKGGIFLHQGNISEMKTGEGKTLVATFPAYLNALTGRGVHIVTVNDYLAQRDAEEMKPLFDWLGLSVGSIEHEATPDERRQTYLRDIVYCSNKEIAFDYLRDQVKIGQGTGDIRLRLRKMQGDDSDAPVMRGLHFAVVDEADSVLIDEARTPLILSQETDVAAEALWAQTTYSLADQMFEDLHYKTHSSEKRIELTEFGKDRLEEFCKPLDPLWHNKIQREHAVGQALTARTFFEEGDQYVIQDGKVVIVDEYTGRLMPERSWNDGLHQLVEYKEGLELTGRKLAIARTTYQKFFRRYMRLAGMSGTVQEVQREISAVYRIPTLRLPTRLPSKMRFLGTRITRREEAKLDLIASRVNELRSKGQAVLIGTRTVGASDKISAYLTKRNVQHDVLNAVNADEEAEVIKDAGQPGRVTVATNMAGRGVHIHVPDTVIDAGGLHVMLTERHDSARIARQLIGRTARQGQPGSYETILSLDDPLVTAIKTPLVSSLAQLPGFLGRPFALMAFRRSQKRAEGLNARARRQLIKMDRQLDRVLAFSGFEK